MTDSLNTEDTEKLLQFQDATGIEDLVTCRRILEEHNWNVHLALHHHLGEDVNPELQNNTRGSLYNSEDDSYNNRSVVQWGLYVFTFPFKLVLHTIRKILGILSVFVRPLLRRFIQPPAPIDPLGDVTSFIHEYEVKYGLNHPNFYIGTYSDALNYAKRNLKFLLAYLHCEDHQDTGSFCRDTLGNPKVIPFINENVVFWACSVKKAEGYRVSQSLRENGYPFLALIVLKNNKMTAVNRLEGLILPEALINKLQTSMNENETSLIRARIEREERDFTQVLRRQQDEAYQESLKADKEKERRKQELKLQKELEEKLLIEKEEELKRQKEEIRKNKIDLVTEIPDEPPLDHPDTIRMVIKLPKGIRLERRFLKTHSMKALFYFVFCHPDSPDRFEIATSYPRKVINCQPMSPNEDPPTFQEAGFGKSDTLCVYDLEA